LAAFPKWRRRLRNIPWVLGCRCLLLASPVVVVVRVTFSPGRSCSCDAEPVVDAHGSPTFAHYIRLFASPIYLQVWRSRQDRGLDNRDHVLGGYPIAYFLGDRHQ